MNAAVRVALVAVGLLVVAPLPLPGEVIFQGGDFDLSLWTAEVAYKVANPTFTATRSAAGGNPDAYWNVKQRTDHASPERIWLFHADAGNFVYAPSTTGAIQTVDFSLDFKSLSAPAGYQAFGSMVKQGGQFYYGTGTYILADKVAWTTNSVSAMTAESFRTILNETLHPDFSASGGPITFGFFTANSNALERIAGYDNFSVTVKPIPEPSCIALVGSGLAGLAVVAWRRRGRPR